LSVAHGILIVLLVLLLPNPTGAIRIALVTSHPLDSIASTTIEVLKDEVSGPTTIGGRGVAETFFAASVNKGVVITSLPFRELFVSVETDPTNLYVQTPTPMRKHVVGYGPIKRLSSQSNHLHGFTALK